MDNQLVDEGGERHPFQPRKRDADWCEFCRCHKSSAAHAVNEEKNSAVPAGQSIKDSELKAAPAFTSAPQLPPHPVDRYVLEYWSVLSTSIARSVATYYTNATAAEVWPDDDFYRNAPPFVDSWLVNGWASGRVLGWLNIMPDPSTEKVYWAETDALKTLILNLEQRAAWARKEIERTENIITDARTALASVHGGEAESAESGK